MMQDRTKRNGPRSNDARVGKDRTFHIRDVLDGQTLGAAIKRLLGEMSWAEVKALIAGRRAQVNGNLVLDDARRLATRDVLKVFEHPRAPVPTDRDVRVLHIDGDLIVVEKPAGMTTLRHAQERGWDDRRKERQPTLEEVLQRLLPSLMPRIAAPAVDAPGATASGGRGHPLFRDAQRGSRPAKTPRKGKAAPRHSPVPPRVIPRVRPVHRLDRDTSGLMVFALSPTAERVLVGMFKEHTIRRVYLAVAHGRVEAQTFQSWLIRDRGDGLRGSAPAQQAAEGTQRAVTHVKPLEHLEDGYTLIECRLETGRTHQIRIHLAEAGHMLCGERVYTRPTPAGPPTPDRSGAPRHALHSAELEMSHPISGRTMRFTAALPSDLGEWLKRLRPAHRG